MNSVQLIHAIESAIDAGDSATAKRHLKLLAKDVKALEFRNQRGQRDKAIVSSLLTKVSSDLETSLQIQKRFVASVSHEIRTPLNAIMGFMKLLSDSQLTEQQKAWLSHSLESSQHLLTLINDVLDVSKAEAGQLELKLQSVALDDLLKETVALIQPRLQDRAVTVQMDIPTLTNCFIADPIRVKQIMFHLLSNAEKFTQKGHIRMQLTLTPMDARFVNVQIRIEDTGIGIPEDKLDSLFMPFVQVHQRANHEGTGLGLYLSQALAKLMGGSIQLTSEEGVGTVCLVNLTLAQGGLKPEKQTLTPEPVMTQAKTLSVLVVDDVELNRFLLKQILLRYFDITATLANDGLEAVTLAQNSAFDLILMDIQMPNMNGLEATREILKLRPDQVIYAVSANAFAEDVESAILAGMKGFLAKPVQIPLLKDVIASCCPSEKLTKT